MTPQYDLDFDAAGEELQAPEPPASELLVPHLQLPKVSRNLTVKRAQQELVEGVKEGVKCQCCGKLAKVYRRKLNAGMAKALIILTHLSKLPVVSDEAGFVASADLFKTLGGQHRDWYLLAHWGLIERGTPTRSKTREGAGTWRPTFDGRMFVEKHANVARYAVLYDGVLIGYEGELVSVVDALGDRFDYSELMSWGGA